MELIPVFAQWFQGVTSMDQGAGPALARTGQRAAVLCLLPG